MQLSYDSRGNIVPTILLMMQSHLYNRGGLRVRVNVYFLEQFCIRNYDSVVEKISSFTGFICWLYIIGRRNFQDKW